MIALHRSFRIFGSFQIGRTAQISDATSISGNVLEIFNIQLQDEGPFFSLARVTEIKADEALPGNPIEADLPPPGDNIFLDDARDRIETALNDGSQVSFWISRPFDGLTGTGERRLFVYDALFLDQFNNSEDENPTDRFPLVPSFKENNEERSSRISFGSGGGSFDLRMELGFAMPLPIGTRAHNPEHPGGVLCLGGLFETTHADVSHLTVSRFTLIGPSNDTDLISAPCQFGATGIGETPPIGKPILPVSETRSAPQMQSMMDVIGFDGQENAIGSDHVIEFRSAPIEIKQVQAFHYSVSCRRRIKLKRGTHIDLSGSVARLDMNEQFGGMIEVDQKSLLVECHWSVNISDAILLKTLLNTDRAEELPGEIHTSMRWTSTAKLADGVLGVAETSAPRDSDDRLILRAAGLEEAARLSLISRLAMTASQRQPQSILPTLSDPVQTSKRLFPIIGYVRGLTSSIMLGNKPTFTRKSASQSRVASLGITLDTKLLNKGDETEGVSSRNLELLHLPIDLGWPSEKIWALPPKEAEALPMRISLDGIDDGILDPNPKVDHNHICLGFDKQASEDEGIRIALGNDKSASTSPHEGDHHYAGIEARLGSISFSRRGHLLADSNKSNLVIQRRDRRSLNLRNAAASMPTIDLEWTLAFAIDTAQPITTDIPHGDRDERPNDLLIRETQPDISSELIETPAFVLTAHERLRDDQDRHLRASLHERRSDSSDSRATFTVLSSAPFSIYRFSRQPLSASLDPTKPVATYDSDSRQWRLLKASETYQYTRPAGAIGEDADKPGMLELHDPAERSETTRPVIPAMDGVDRRHVLDMRMSPPSTIWVDPSDLTRDFFLPEYAGRELFRQRGDFGLGMKLAGTRSELLYGLSTGLNIPDNKDGSPGPRIAELQTLTGRMVRKDITTKDTDAAMRKRWSSLHQAFEQRPERLEVWTLDTRRENPFVPARFDDGLTFSLRSTALLAPPVKSGDYDTTEATPINVKPPRFHPHGLSGGALWPLESANVNRVIASNPVGTGGTLDSMVFSPLGDSGNQTVQFLDGYVTVITETKDGHLHKQRVEILGRIAGLWHRAKHVVIYERTTAPSPQFTPNPNQPTRTRRPVLRKVEEFVEILQPNRRYPDMPDVEPRSRGFLEEVRFNSTIIHVNSAWGGDVGSDGWEVPLWNRGEALIRPQIYPYPDVAFLTSAEGNSKSPQATQECLDVANLYFYTDPVAAQKTINTDLWPVRTGVDTSNLGSPDVLRKIMSDDAGEANEGRRTAASRVLPGYKRFTWRLAPSAIRTRINNERGTKPIFAGVESVSLMRHPGKFSKEKLEILEKNELAEIANRGKFSDFGNEIRDDISLPLSKENPPPEMPSYKAVVDAIKAINDSGSPDVAQVQALKSSLNNLAVGGTARELNKVLDKSGAGLFQKAQNLLSGPRKLIDRARSLEVEDCKSIASKAVSSIRQRKLLALQLVRQTESETLSHIRSVENISRPKVKQHLRDELEKNTRDLFDQANQGLGDVRGGVATAKAVITDWQADAIAALSRARARVTELRTGYDDNKPWSRNRIDQALARVKKEFAAAEEEALAALDEARLRLATEIDSAANGVGARASQTIAQILRTEKQLLTRYDSIEDAVIRGAANVNSEINKLPTQADLDSKIAELQTKVSGMSAGTIKNKAQATVTKLKGFVVDLKINTRKSQARNAVKATLKTTDKTLTEISNATKQASETATSAMEEVKDFAAEIQNAANEFVDDETAELKAITNLFHNELSGALDGIAQGLKDELREWKDETDALDQAVAEAAEWVDANSRLIESAANKAVESVNGWLSVFEDRLDEADDILNNELRQRFGKQVIDPVVDAVFETTDWPEEGEFEAIRAHAINVVQTLADRFEEKLDEFSALPLSAIKEAEEACIALMGYKAKLFEDIDKFANQAEAELKKALAPITEELDEVIADITKWAEHGEKILGGANKLLDTTNEIGNQLTEAGENVRAYLDRGAEILSRAGDAKPGELPGLALQLISAATHAPEIAAFRANADRIRVLLDDAKEVLETPEIKGVLDQLGDALKALGLDFDFKEFGDSFNFESNKDDLLRKLIPDFGGIKLSDMLPRAKIPGGIKNAVKVTHDLDTKAGRAWVRADVNVPLPGRETLFTIGPFTLFMKDSNLSAFVRAEASKDKKETAVSDQALLLTNIEAVVAGQVMVTLEDVAVSYSTRDQLNFAIDPKKIRIHSAMQFIQDTLGSIFGDELGGLTFIKEGGIPVGVEHLFTMPPLSLMYGTSGVTNIQISNRFALRAYPDFIISNRFNLSRRELPFLFSIFIIGGTGYIQVDTEYRPFDKQLMVIVEAGVGGSASLGFAFGPVAGSVFITISVVIRYQKQIGTGPSSDQGLSVSLVLVIAGNVSLWGMVTIYLGISLSITYHESGKVDGLGQLSVELKISRWFKLRYSTQVRYKLRDGRSTTQVTSETSTSGKYQEALEKFKALEKARESL